MDRRRSGRLENGTRRRARHASRKVCCRKVHRKNYDMCRNYRAGARAGRFVSTRMQMSALPCLLLRRQSLRFRRGNPRTRSHHASPHCIRDSRPQDSPCPAPLRERPGQDARFRTGLSARPTSVRTRCSPGRHRTGSNGALRRWRTCQSISFVPQSASVRRHEFGDIS